MKTDFKLPKPENDRFHDSGSDVWTKEKLLSNFEKLKALKRGSQIKFTGKKFTGIKFTEIQFNKD